MIDVSALGADARRQIAEQVPGPKRGKWRARPATVDGIRFRSQTEARVYGRVRGELLDGQKLVIDCRFPLVATAARIGRASKAGHITVDFTVWRPDVIGAEIVWVIWRAIDAKPRNRAARSRDWRRGARAFTATYGIEIEECDR